MASVLDFPTLDLAGMNVDTVDHSFSLLTANYGDGYQDNALVGSAGGLLEFGLSAGVLPDDATYGSLIGGQSRFAYYYDWYCARMAEGNPPFFIEWRDRMYLVSFKETRLSYEVFTSDLFTTGLALRQRRVAGIINNDDGSVYHPLTDIAGLQAWYSAHDDGASAVNLPDLSGNGYDLVGELPMPDRTTNGGVDVFRWNGTNDNPFSGSDAYVFTHIFLVGCHTDATFAASPNRGLISGATLAVLVSQVSTTKWTDVGYGANFEYKKNGTAFADNNAQAPMSGALAVMECKFPSTAGIDVGLRIGGDRTDGTRYWKGDFAHLIIVNNAAMTSAQEYMIRRFIARECGDIAVVE